MIRPTLEEVCAEAIEACPINGPSRWIVKKSYSALSEYLPINFNGLVFKENISIPWISTASGGTVHYLACCKQVFDRPGIGFEIGIDSDLVTENPLDDKMFFSRHALLHELLHQIAMERFGAFDPMRYSHGDFFSKCCNRVGASFGWPRVRSQYKRSGKRRHCIPSAAEWPFNVQGDDYKLAFSKTLRRARQKFFSAQPPVVPDADKVKVRGLEGLKTLEDFILNETQPTVDELQALQKIGDLVRLIVPGFHFQYLKKNAGELAIYNRVSTLSSLEKGKVNGGSPI